MQHRLVQQIENALGWVGPGRVGVEFSVGRMPEPSVCNRLLTPRVLLGFILRRSLTYPQLRCLRHGADLHPTAYLTTTTTGRGQRIQVADMRKLGLLLRDGATVVLDDVGPLDATLEASCRALGWWAGEIVRVNTYLTTQDADGWGLHWDSHDVLCVQLAGEKNWEVRGPSRIAPMERDAASNPEPSADLVWSGTMRAGDVMHIPRGWWHQATRGGKGNGFSLHATFGLTRRTGVDWLTWVADQARTDELFRRDLDKHDAIDGCETQRRALVEAAAELVHRSPPSGYLTARERERGTSRQIVTFGVFGPVDVVACVTDFPPQLRIHDEKVVVHTAGKKITLPAAALPALRLLLSGQPADIKRISADTGVNATALAKVLVAEGICAEITPDLAAGYDGMLTSEQALLSESGRRFRSAFPDQRMKPTTDTESEPGEMLA